MDSREQSSTSANAHVGTVEPGEASPRTLSDDENETDPEAIKSYLISQKNKLKASNGGPIADKELGEAMLIPLLKDLTLASKDNPVTLQFAKAEWGKYKSGWLQKHAVPGKQSRQTRPGMAGGKPQRRPLQVKAPPAPPPLGSCLAEAKQASPAPQMRRDSKEEVP